jgi:hypothetical protein
VQDAIRSDVTFEEVKTKAKTKKLEENIKQEVII